MEKKVRKRLVVFASGSGTTLQAIIDAVRSEDLNAEIALVVSDKKDAYALERAKMAGICTYVIHAKEPDKIDCELSSLLGQFEVDLIVLAGYLKMIGPKLIKEYTIINTHPSLLPKYGGKGMHGMKVHEAVVQNKERESGVTVHLVDDKYDHGHIIRQTKVPVYPCDQAEDVSARVQAAEKPQLVSVIKDFAEGKIDFSNL